MTEKRKKILIIEDDQILADMYGLKFKKDGYEVLITENGADGLNLAKTKKPTVILLDIILPQLDGFSILAELKKNATTKKIPVILLTNLGQGGDLEKGKNLGADGYLTKANTTPDEIMKQIKNILENREK
ncbi:response regulator transcription factor [Patescibacteria group bacterium]